MKKIIIFTLLLIVVTYLIVSCFYDVYNEHLFFVKNKNIRVFRNSKKIVEVIPLDEYIVGVVAGEMPLTFTDEALKAQAVASRSYAYKKMLYNKNNEYDVIDTVTNQVYLDNETLKNAWKDDYEKNINRIRKIVKDTQDEFVTYNNEVIDALFFSTSIGITENSENVFSKEVPYLRSVVSTWDEISPLYKVNNKYSSKDFYNKLSLPYNDNLKIEYIDISKTGKVSKIKINDNVIDAKKIVDTFNLKSYYFKIVKDNDNVIITTSGYGHGVGMSQYGANAMSLKGYNYKEILKYYYKDVEITKI